MQVNRKDYIPRRVEFYCNELSVEKILTVIEVRSFNGRLNPAIVEMVNPVKNSKTIIEFQDIEYDRSLDDSLFHPRQFFR